MMRTAGLSLLICRVIRWHHWQTNTNDDGSRYVACARCGKVSQGAPLGKNTIGA